MTASGEIKSYLETLREERKQGARATADQFIKADRPAIFNEEFGEVVQVAPTIDRSRKSSSRKTARPSVRPLPADPDFAARGAAADKTLAQTHRDYQPGSWTRPSYDRPLYKPPVRKEAEKDERKRIARLRREGIINTRGDNRLIFRQAVEPSVKEAMNVVGIGQTFREGEMNPAMVKKIEDSIPAIHAVAKTPILQAHFGERKSRAEYIVWLRKQERRRKTAQKAQEQNQLRFL